MNEEKLILTEKNDLGNGLDIVKLVKSRIMKWSSGEIKENHLNINGIWGSGKTTIAKNVCEQIEKENETNSTQKFKTKIINVWEYETSQTPILNIIIDFMNILDIKEKQWWKELFSSISLSWNIPIFGVSIGSNNKKNSNDFSQDIKNHNKQKAIIDIMNKEFIKEANTKYVVVLDELDRCSPHKIIEILSLINFILLKIKSVYFIVCTNNEVINQLESKFYNTNELNEEKYIDKIFHQKLDLELISDIKKLPLEIENNELICIFLNETKISNFRLIKKVAKHVDNFIKNQELNKSIIKFVKRHMHPYLSFGLNKSLNYFSKIVYFWIFIFFYWKIYKKEIFIDFFNRKKDLKVNNPMHLKKFIEQNNIELKTPTTTRKIRTK